MNNMFSAYCSLTVRIYLIHTGKTTWYKEIKEKTLSNTNCNITQIVLQYNQTQKEDNQHGAE